MPRFLHLWRPLEPSSSRLYCFKVDAVRKMVETDVVQSAQVLGRAFCDNPAMMAIIERDSEARAALLARFLQRSLPVYLRAGACWVACEGDRVRSVMLTLPPGAYPLSWVHDLEMGWFALLNGGLSTTRRFLKVDAFIRGQHPEREYTYLYMLGTDPSAQGCGHASRLLTRLAQEANGVEVYLETDAPKNLPFYERHGYRVLGEAQSPLEDAAFPMWFLSSHAERYG